MKNLKQAALILACLLGAGFPARAAQQPLRASNQQVAQLLTQVEAHTDDFRASLTEAIDRSFLRDAELGQYVKRFVREFEQLTDRLRERRQDGQPLSASVQEVLNRAPYFDTLLSSYDLGPRAERAWQLLYADLNQLARNYNLPTYWGVPRSLGAPVTVDINALANRLIGTYELDGSQSDDVRAVIERAVEELPPTERRRALSTLLLHLRSPEFLALDRQAERVTLASSLQPARVYQVSSHAQRDGGPPAAVLLYGDQLRLNTVAETDSLYSVTFNSTDQGARLLVSRTALLPQFARPVVVNSYYKKIADAPRLNLSAEEPNEIVTGEQTKSVQKKNPR